MISDILSIFFIHHALKRSVDDDDGKLIDTRYHHLINDIRHKDDDISYDGYQIWLSFSMRSDIGIATDIDTRYYLQES